MFSVDPILLVSAEVLSLNCSYIFLLKLKIAPETEYVNGSEINIAGLKSLWLFARNGEASIWKKSKENAHRDVFYKLSVSSGCLMLFNSSKKIVDTLVIIMNLQLSHAF